MFEWQGKILIRLNSAGLPCRASALMTADEIEKIYLNRNVANPDVLFLETESSDLEKELFIEGYDEEGQLVRYNVSRKAVIVEKGQRNTYCSV